MRLRPRQWPNFGLGAIIYYISSGFHPSTFIYSHFSPKIQSFYSLLSSLSPRGISRVDSERKAFKIQVSRLPENTFPTLFLTAEAQLVNMIFFQWMSVENNSIPVMFAYTFFVCSGSNFCWKFIVLWGVLKKSWQEKYIQLSFMRVCRYLSQRVRRIGE